MRKNEELYQKVQEWFARMPKQLRCPACADHHWELRFLEDTVGTENAPAQTPSVITVMCSCCGHLSFFDAKVMGLKD